jgi:hypothetical protein
MLPGLVFPKNPGYRTNAVKFDGSTYATRGAALTGAADGKTGILSFWFKFEGGDGAAQTLIQSAGSGDVSVTRTAGNVFRILLYNADNTTAAFDVSSTPTYTADGVWHHFLASWDAAATTIRWYIDGASIGFGTNAGPTNVTIFYSVTDWFFGANNSAGNKSNASIAEFYFNQATSLDISVQSNREKFRSPSGIPQDLGGTGSVPTGSAPIIYFRGPASAWNTNRGTGGNFSTAAGAILNSPTSPSYGT